LLMQYLALVKKIILKENFIQIIGIMQEII